MEKKYSYGFKLDVVQEYLQGTSGTNLLAQKYQVLGPSLIRKWVNQYQEYGKEGLQVKKTKKKYPLDFKLNVLKFKQDTGASYKDTANAFGISEPSIIANWRRSYLKEGAPGLNKPIGRPPKMTKSNSEEKKKNQQKKLPTSEAEIELLKKENEYLRIELEYLKKLKARGLKDPRENNNQE